MRMKKWPIVALLTAFPCLAGNGGRAAEPAVPPVLERTIALKGVSGRIDHLAVDLGRKRLFVAELGNGTVDVIDLAAGAVIHRIEGLKEPQGVAYAPGADVLAIASAGDGSVGLFRGAELSPTGSINLGDDADNVRLDTRTGNLVVGYGSGGLAVIDPAKSSLLSRIPLPAHPESFQLDPDKRRAFVNLPGAHQIAVVDMQTNRQTASWQMPKFRANFPMALDARHSEHRHRHDEHHRHDHGLTDPLGEPHSHWHRHVRLVHRHPHYPDLHHRHGHHHA
jgi:DNA-binding beta-propeller fold protein YncE